MNLHDTRQAAAYCGLSDRTLEVWRLQQVGPAYFKLGCAVRYTLDDFNTWLAGHRCAGPQRQLHQPGKPQAAPDHPAR